MRPIELKTRIFLDSGDPGETREILSVLGFLDGQTTNPSLIAKNPDTARKKFTKGNLLKFYRKVVEEVSNLIPQGSVSIEVYADQKTSAEEMLNQGREFFKWIPNAHIKYPATAEGLKAAQQSVAENMRVNITLVFSQEQAAAVYSATLNQSSAAADSGTGQARGQIFVSPFIGRLDDRGEDGMDLIKNIIRMYKSGDGHVEVLTASVRSVGHLKRAIELGSDIITAPFKVLKEWADIGLQIDVIPNPSSLIPNLKPIPYREIRLNQPWQSYNIRHELTDKGLQKFSEDWNNLMCR